MLNLATEIFREYDIRGQYPLKLNETVAHLVGQALGSEILSAGQHHCFLAWDGRHSSPSLRDALISGICATGCHVKLIGPAPTAVAFWAVKNSGQSCAVITGSHNPKQDNGIKMAVAGSARSGEDIQVLLSRIQLSLFKQGSGLVEDASHLIDDYQQRLIENIRISKPLKIVLDAGHGIGGPIASTAFKQLGLEVIEIGCKVDGDFPLHHPDPAKTKNLQWLQQAVMEEQADFGIALDGDADRIGVVDNLGNAILPDRLSLLFIEDVLKNHPGATCLFDVKCSALLQTCAEKVGGQGMMIATGHTSMKKAIKETGAVFATELSGHILFNDSQGLGVDDGIYAGIRLCELMSRSQESLAEKLAAYPATYATQEIQIPVADSDKFSIMSVISSHCFKQEDTNKVDGVRVQFAKGWALVRASNTTPCLTLRFEALAKQDLMDIQTMVKKELLQHLPDLPVDF